MLQAETGGGFDGSPQSKFEHDGSQNLVSDAPWPHGTFPAVAPGVLAVGGTQVTALNSWQERAWSAPLSCRLQADLKLKCMASSGGFSEYMAIPEWQQSVLQSYYSRSGNTPSVIPYGRGFPDVVLAAWGCNHLSETESRESAYWGFMDQWHNDAGGTSLAAPIWAGIIALLNQARRETDLSRLGLVNPLLYQLKANKSKSLCSIPQGNTDLEIMAINHQGQATLYYLPGFDSDAAVWNPATGLGIPKVAEFLSEISVI